jgi:hypothetical protein
VELVIHRVVHMQSPGTLSTVEALLFAAIVLLMAGAGTWVSVIG